MLFLLATEMFISHKHKFIFFHSEKCAGTFIEKSLCKALGVEEWKTAWASKEWRNGIGKNLDGQFTKHIPPWKLKKAWGSEFDEYETWTSIRDPWSQISSLYGMLTQWEKYASMQGFHANKFGRIHPVNDFKDINEWIHFSAQNKGPEKSLNIFKRFCNYHSDFGQNLIQNYIFYDDLQVGLSKMSKRLGIKEIQADSLKRKESDNGETIHCTSEADERKVLTAWSSKIISGLCSRDIEKYNFVNPFN